LVILFSPIAIPCILPAQAWVAPRGQGAVAISYQNTYVHNHLNFDGQLWQLGDINSQAVTVDTDYSLTDKLAVRIALPYVFGRYTGDTMFAHSPAVDDGFYHSTFQNFTTDVRYNVSQRPVVFTPFFRLVAPSHSYEYYAHAAVGRGLREYHVGVNIGRVLTPVLPRAYVQAQVSYAFAERILGISPNRTNAEVQLGYFLTPRVVLLGSIQWYHTYSSIQAHFEIPPPSGLTDEQWLHHDQIGKESLLDAGAGVSFRLNSRMSMFVSYGRSFTGANGHLHAAVGTISFIRTFGSEDGSLSSGISRGTPPPDQAIICTCAKGR
jgi:hypothetical protein